MKKLEIGLVSGIVLFFVVAVVFIVLYATSRSSSNNDERSASDDTEKSSSNDNERHYLSVGAMFKNESHILKEWVEHYLAEGVSHFYLINDHSTDDFEAILQPYLELGLVEVFLNEEFDNQQVALNKYIFPRLSETQYILMIDLDEFVYARRGFDTIPEYLKQFDTQEIYQIVLLWRFFGSDGNVLQPKSVVQGNLTRVSLDVSDERNIKCLVNTDKIQAIGIHSHVLKPGHEAKLQLPDNTTNYHSMDVCLKMSETDANNLFLQHNHYRNQSEEFWLKVKNKRGDVFYSNRERNMSHFENNNANSDVVDNELSKKHIQPLKESTAPETSQNSRKITAGS